MTTFDAGFNALLVRVARKKARIESLAVLCVKALRLVPEGADASSPRFVIVSRTSYANALPWRATYFDEIGPSGHTEARTPAEAISEAEMRFGALVLVEHC